MMTDKYEVPKRYTALNDITGDLIKSRTDEQDKYSEGWDRLWGGNKTVIFKPDHVCRISPFVEKVDWNETCVGWNSCYHCDNGYYPCDQNCMLE